MNGSSTHIFILFPDEYYFDLTKILSSTVQILMYKNYTSALIMPYKKEYLCVALSNRVFQ